MNISTSIKTLSVILGTIVGTSAHSTEPVALAHQKATSALSTFVERLEYCSELREVIPAERFEHLDASEEQLRLILSYRSALASFECSRSEISHYLLYSSMLQNMETEISAELSEGNHLVTHDALTALRREADYLALPARMRAQLDSMPELKTPFDLSGTARALGL